MIDTKRLKSKIVLSGMTQRSLAEAVGMSVNTLNSKINGSSSFRCDEVEAICNTLGIDSAEEKLGIFFAN